MCNVLLLLLLIAMSPVSLPHASPQPSSSSSIIMSFNSAFNRRPIYSMFGHRGGTSRPFFACVAALSIQLGPFFPSRMYHRVFVLKHFAGSTSATMSYVMKKLFHFSTLVMLTLPSVDTLTNPQRFNRYIHLSWSIPTYRGNDDWFNWSILFVYSSFESRRTSRVGLSSAWSQRRYQWERNELSCINDSNPANNVSQLFSGQSVDIYVSIVMLWRKMRLWYAKEVGFCTYNIVWNVQCLRAQIES